MQFLITLGIEMHCICKHSKWIAHILRKAGSAAVNLHTSETTENEYRNGHMKQFESQRQKRVRTRAEWVYCGAIHYSKKPTKKNNKP